VSEPVRVEPNVGNQPFCASDSVDPLVDVTEERSDKEISRAIGEEFRRAREARGWSQRQLVTRLPSGIGERTLLSYEHGARHLSFLRFLELCRALGEDAPSLARRALQRARIHLQNLTLRVDLRELLQDRSNTFRPVMQWARNTLNENPNGTVDIEPVVVKHLALFVGCDYRDLANYLARFLPEED
jgi:transcriptional regulator with XRE-family HTH domain